MNRRTGWLRLLAALGGEVVAISVLTSIRPAGTSSGSDAASPLASPDPIDAASGAARWLAIALLAYLVAITVLQLVAVALGSTDATSRAGALLARFVARLGPRAVAGIATAATLASAASACVPPADARPHSAAAIRPPIVMVLESTPGAPLPSPTVTMLLETDSTTTTAPVTTTPATPAPVTSTPPAAALASAPSGATGDLHAIGELATVEVAPGDSFWSIADHAVSTRLGRRATDDEIRSYWTLLIEVNRSRLVRADEPDLIYAGQRFVLP